MEEQPMMVDAEKARECLRVLGVGISEDDEMPRTVALGFLLCALEFAALAENDRLDQEGIREGYFAALTSLAHSTPTAEDDRHAIMAYAWARIAESRLARTVLDLKVTAAPTRPGEWTVSPAVHELLDGAAVLLAAANPAGVADVEDQDQDDVRAMRDALRNARHHLTAARQHIEDGRRTVRKMGLEP